MRNIRAVCRTASLRVSHPTRIIAQDMGVAETDEARKLVTDIVEQKIEDRASARQGTMKGWLKRIDTWPAVEQPSEALDTAFALPELSPEVCAELSELCMQQYDI